MAGLHWTETSSTTKQYQKKQTIQTKATLTLLGSPQNPQQQIWESKKSESHFCKPIWSHSKKPQSKSIKCRKSVINQKTNINIHEPNTVATQPLQQIDHPTESRLPCLPPGPNSDGALALTRMEPNLVGLEGEHQSYSHTVLWCWAWWLWMVLSFCDLITWDSMTHVVALSGGISSYPTFSCVCSCFPLLVTWLRMPLHQPRVEAA